MNIYIVIPLCVNEIVDNPFLMKVIFYIFCLQTAGEQNEIKKKKKSRYDIRVHFSRRL